MRESSTPGGTLKDAEAQLGDELTGGSPSIGASSSRHRKRASGQTQQRQGSEDAQRQARCHDRGREAWRGSNWAGRTPGQVHATGPGMYGHRQKDGPTTQHISGGPFIMLFRAHIGRRGWTAHGRRCCRAMHRARFTTGGGTTILRLSSGENVSMHR